MTERRIILAIASIFIASVALAQKYGSVIDRTVAVVGNSMIPLSQVESEAMMLQFEGYVTDGDIRCEILEELMLNKLFYTQACLDSLTVNMDIVNYQLENKIATIMSRFGSEKEVEAYFGKTMNRLKSEWAKMFEEQSLSDEMKRKVASNMPEITPREIRDFYKRLPEDSIPMIPAMYSYSQIVVYPDREKAALEVKERLLEFRDRVIKGEKFSTLARLYSVCPSAANGGELGMASKNLYWPAFSDAAMALKEGQVSPIVETPDGFHIIQLIERRGDLFNARHILLKPYYSDQDRKEAFAKLDSIRNVIASDSLSFEQAAMVYSMDMASKTNGGGVANEEGASFFEIDKLKPADYQMLANLKPGEVSKPFESTDNEGNTGNTVYKIVRLDEMIPAHKANYEKDYNILSNMAKNQRAINAIENFAKEKQRVTYIVIDPLFSKCKFKREGWIK